MAGKSAIEWTENSWNPATGCTQVSPGCDRCYAMRLVNVRQVNNPRSPRYGHTFDEVMLHAERLDQPGCADGKILQNQRSQRPLTTLILKWLGNDHELRTFLESVNNSGFTKPRENITETVIIDSI